MASVGPAAQAPTGRDRAAVLRGHDRGAGRRCPQLLGRNREEPDQPSHCRASARFVAAHLGRSAPVNVNDLSEMMRQRSDVDPVPILAESRIAGVKRKVDVVRRRWVAASVAAVAAVVTVVPLTPHFLHGGKTNMPVAAPSAAFTINGLPEYADGGHLVATKTAALTQTISLTVMRTDLGLLFSNRCPVQQPNVQFDVTMTLSDETHLLVGCSTGSFYSSDDSLATEIKPGVPTVLTFTAKAYRVTTGPNGEQTSKTPISAPRGTYTIGVYQEVPFAQYPLSPRPRKLPALDVMPFGLGSGSSAIQTVDSDPNDPLAPRTLSSTMPECGTTAVNCNPAVATSQTPGFLQITVNGVVASTAEFWDYSGIGWMFNIVPGMNDKLRLHAGEQVTVTVTPRYVTGAWKFA